MSRWEKESHLKYCSPTPKFIIFGVGFLLASFIVRGAEKIVNQFYELINKDSIADYDNVMILFTVIGYKMSR